MFTRVLTSIYSWPKCPSNRVNFLGDCESVKHSRARQQVYNMCSNDHIWMQSIVWCCQPSLPTQRSKEHAVRINLHAGGRRWKDLLEKIKTPSPAAAERQRSLGENKEEPAARLQRSCELRLLIRTRQQAAPPNELPHRCLSWTSSLGSIFISLFSVSPFPRQTRRWCHRQLTPLITSLSLVWGAQTFVTPPRSSSSDVGKIMRDYNEVMEK